MKGFFLFHCIARRMVSLTCTSFFENFGQSSLWPMISATLDTKVTWRPVLIALDTPWTLLGRVIQQGTATFHWPMGRTINWEMGGGVLNCVREQKVEITAVCSWLWVGHASSTCPVTSLQQWTIAWICEPKEPFLPKLLFARIKYSPRKGTRADS